MTIYTNKYFVALSVFALIGCIVTEIVIAGGF